MSEKSRQTVREHARTEVSESTTERPEQTCPDCSGQIVVDEHDETICADCGLVLEATSIDRGPEWRTFNTKERDKKKRTGAPTTVLMHDKGLSSKIGWKNQDAAGNSLSARQRRKMQRLRTWDERYRTRNPSERNLKQALGEIERMASALGLPETVQETASVIYRRALAENLIRGRSIEAVATAALHAAARQASTPRTIDEVAAVSRIDQKHFERAYRQISRDLSLGIKPADPVSYVGRFASDLGISDEADRRARDLLETAKRQGLHSGKSPVGLAAAAVYAACRLTEEEVTQDEVSTVSGVSEVTIRNRYRELLGAR